MAQTARPFGFLSTREVLDRAAARLGTIVRQDWQGTRALTAHIGEPYALNGELLQIFRDCGFELDQRPDGVTTLRDTDQYERTPGFARSCYWNFITRDGERHDPLQLSLGLELAVSKPYQSVRCVPRAWGPFLSAGDEVPNQHACAILVSWGLGHDRPLESLVVKACKEGSVLIPLSDLGLDGIRPVRELFREFVGPRENVSRFANSHLSTFDPAPYPTPPAYTEFYVPRSKQASLKARWKNQLEGFRKSL